MQTKEKKTILGGVLVKNFDPETPKPPKQEDIIAVVSSYLEIKFHVPESEKEKLSLDERYVRIR